jgi:hypothetical protein
MVGVGVVDGEGETDGNTMKFVGGALIDTVVP